MTTHKVKETAHDFLARVTKILEKDIREKEMKPSEGQKLLAALQRFTSPMDMATISVRDIITMGFQLRERANMSDSPRAYEDARIANLIIENI